MEKNLRISDITMGAYAFVWSVPTENLELVDGKYLVAESECQWRRYSPMKVPELHRRFANLFNEYSIKKFAEQYGFLTNDPSMVVREGKPVVPCERLSTWKKASKEMGMLLEIWDLVKAKNADKLGKYVTWPNGDSVQVISGSKPQLIASKNPDFHPEVMRHWKVGDTIEPAHYYVCRELNKNLKGHFSPQILPFLDDKVYLFPDSLLSAMWLLFLQEVVGVHRLRQCDICGEWKEQRRERSPFYCSPACRKRAYDMRKRKRKTESVHNLDDQTGGSK